VKVIVVAGYFRTGSTWLFNLIKHSLLSEGYTVSQAGNHEIPPPITDFHIIKTHTWSQDLFWKSDYVFTSHRDLNEIKASYIRFTGVALEGPEAEQSWADYLQWNSFSNYAMPFGIMVQCPSIVANAVIYALGLKCDPNEVLKIVSEIKPPSKGYDPDSFYYSNHITKKP